MSAFLYSPQGFPNLEMALQDSVIASLRVALPRLKERYGVRKLRLYGSVARGDETNDSDVDIIVEFDETPTLFELGRIKEDLEALLGRRVDVTTPGGLHPFVRAEAQREGLDVEAHAA